MKFVFSFLLLFGLLYYILSAPVTLNHRPLHAELLNSPEKPLRDKVIDDLDGVEIYFNGNMTNTYGRHLSKDGYNLGLRWQCVEFVKRYYYELYDHKMPDSYGHAKDFFDTSIGMGWNEERALHQFPTGSPRKPQKGMILVFGATAENPYGHIGVVAEVNADSLILAQQNWGTTTRMKLDYHVKERNYYITHPDVLGWLSL